ncbi:MAG TPA: hypothetical protein VLC51_04890, partial [Nitrospira sp.]|nr:hypothetical protein [Nitrospira sp.]
MANQTRRELLKLGAGAAAGACFSGFASCSGNGNVPESFSPAQPVSPPEPEITCSAGDAAEVAVAEGTNLDSMTRAALSSLGGIQTVVKTGDTV